MQAIIMAAGIGSRLSKNPNMPKCMWKVGKLPLIERTVRMLLDNGVDVSIVAGFKKEMMFEALKDYPIQWFVNPFFRTTNSIASLWFARERFSGESDTVLANADVFWEQPILELLLSAKNEVVMLGDASRTETGDYFFRTENGYIVDYGKELKLPERSCEYVGIAKLRSGFVYGFSQRLQELIDTEQYHLWWENVLYENCREQPIFVQDVGNLFWGEIDYLQDFNRISDYVITRG